MGGSLCGEPTPPGRILFLGIPESGKTTAIYRLKLGELVTTIPTHGYNMETIHVGKRVRDVWDVGARVEDRDDFLYCLTDVSAVVFFIDCAADEKKFLLAMNKLQLSLAERELEKCPVAIAANKQDLETNISVFNITNVLKEKDYMKFRYWKVFPTSSVSQQGIQGLNVMMKWVDAHHGKEKKRPPDVVHVPKPKRRRRRGRVTHRSFNKHANRRDEMHHMANKMYTIGEDDYMI